MFLNSAVFYSSTATKMMRHSVCAKSLNRIRKMQEGKIMLLHNEKDSISHFTEFTPTFLCYHRFFKVISDEVGFRNSTE